MIKLTNLQMALLSAGAAPTDGSLLPLPPAIAATKAQIERAVTTLIKRKLATESTTKDREQAYRVDDRKLFAATITDARKTAVPALEPVEPATTLARPGDTSPDMPRDGSKQRLVVDLLGQAGGATLTALCTATGWLPHTTRAALTGLRKRGFNIVSSRGDGETSYRIAG